VSALRTLHFMARRLPSLCELGFRQFLILGGIAAVALAIGAVTKLTLLGGGDIYFYLNVKPPEFWLALAIVAAAVLAAGMVIVVLLLRWMFAVPLVLLEDQSPRDALATSRQWVREIGPWQVLKQLIAWAIGVLVITLVTAAVGGLLGWTLMGLAGNQVSMVVAFAGLLAVIDGLLGLLVSFFAAVTFAALVGRLFLTKRPEARLPDLLQPDAGEGGPANRLRLGTCVFAATIALVCATGVVVYSVIDRIQFDNEVAVTAHRGSSRAAPENSMAAVLRAIDDGADFAEIDVQETADGVVVLFHDTDLRRMAGVDKGIWEVTYDEMRQLDIGSWFSAEFAGTRVATLEEVIGAVQGKLKLNIEMKFNGHDKQLEAEVARLVRDAGFDKQCVVTSLVYGGVQEIARQDDGLRRGLIVTAKLGDATSLDVNLLAVNANAVTRDLITRAHRAGMEVHVWTVNEPGQMLTMIHLGVDNIMTDAPDVLVALLAERARLSNAEKTLLFVSDFLAGRL
jgi:glycerophosphoryl diester phosphodiesterase